MYFNFSLVYAISRVHLSQDGLKLNDIYKLLVYSSDVVSVLDGSVITINKRTNALVYFSKEIALDVNADKTKYMVMSRDHKAGRIHNIKIDNIHLNGLDS
jgi:hypothetical protein